MRFWMVKGWHKLHTDNGGTFDQAPMLYAVIVARDAREAQITLRHDKYWLGHTTAEEIAPGESARIIMIA